MQDAHNVINNDGLRIAGAAGGEEPQDGCVSGKQAVAVTGEEDVHDRAKKEPQAKSGKPTKGKKATKQATKREPRTTRTRTITSPNKLTYNK